MTVAVRELQEAAGKELGAVQEFLSRNTFPIVEGRKVTFVFHGAADEVHLRHWIFGLPSSQAFTRIDGTDLWHAVMDLPESSRVEYKLEVVRRDVHRLIRDPLNPRLAHDPFGANSVCYAEGYETPDWAIHDPDARPGQIESFRMRSRALGDSRVVQVYKPARFRTTSTYPLLVAHDGSDYLRFSGLKTVLDNLIHRLEIPPMVVALIDSARRLREYAADDAHAEFVADELLGTMKSRYPIDERVENLGIMGASFGAVAALSTTWKHPGVFGRLFVQSGSFGFSDIGDHERGPVFDPVVEWVNAFRENPGKPVQKMFVTCGTYESLIYENRSMVPLLQSTGMDVKYLEARDGHNWENWRDRMREGLSWLFPGPLWMVYE